MRKQRRTSYDSSDDSSSDSSSSDSDSDFEPRKSKGKKKVRKDKEDDFELVEAPIDTSVNVVRYDPTLTEDFKTHKGINIPRPKFSGENIGSKDLLTIDEWTT